MWFGARTTQQVGSDGHFSSEWAGLSPPSNDIPTVLDNRKVVSFSFRSHAIDRIEARYLPGILFNFPRSVALRIENWFVSFTSRGTGSDKTPVAKKALLWGGVWCCVHLERKFGAFSKSLRYSADCIRYDDKQLCIVRVALKPPRTPFPFRFRHFLPQLWPVAGKAYSVYVCSLIYQRSWISFLCLAQAVDYAFMQRET